jgi:hypothetical protein
MATSHTLWIGVMCVALWAASADAEDITGPSLKKLLVYGGGGEGSTSAGSSKSTAAPKRIHMERKRVCGDVDSDCLTVRHNGVVLKVSSGLDFNSHTVVDLLARLPCWFGPRRTCTSASKEDATDDAADTAANHINMLVSAYEALVEKREVRFTLRGSELAALTSSDEKNVLRSINPRMGEVVELVKVPKKKREEKKKAESQTGNGAGEEL